MKCASVFFRAGGLLFAVVAVFWLSYATQFRFVEGEFSSPKSKHSAALELPFLKNLNASGSYSFRLHFHRGPLAPTQVRIIPDDYLTSLTVNSHTVNLKEYNALRGDIRRGLKIDLSEKLKTGDNVIDVVVQDYGGEVGLSFRPDISDPSVWIMVLLWCGVVGGVSLGLFRIVGIHWSRGLCYTLIAVGAIIQVGTVIEHNPVEHIWSDPARHWEQGKDVLRVDLMTATDPILYQAFVAVLAKLTLKEPNLVAFYTILLALLCPWLWYRFFRELQPSKTLALAGFAALMLLPSWTSIYSYFMQETLFLPLLGAALWATWRARRKQTLAAFLLMIACWIFAGLTRGIAIPLAAVACSVLWLQQDHKIRKGVYAGMLLVFVLAPLTYRSYHTVGLPSPHGIGQMNSLYARSGARVIEVTSSRQGGRWQHGFGSPSLDSKPFAPFSQWNSEREGTFRVHVNFDKGTEGWNIAEKRIDFGWREYFWLTKENLIYLFLGESWPDNNLARMVDIANYHMRWLWPFLFIFSWFFVFRYRAVLGRDGLLPALILVFVIVQGLLPISVNEGRYRKPLEGLLVAQIVLLSAFASIKQPAPKPSSPYVWPALLRRRPRLEEKNY